jgi:hypothetical protein
MGTTGLPVGLHSNYLTLILILRDKDVLDKLGFDNHKLGMQ